MSAIHLYDVITDAVEDIHPQTYPTNDAKFPAERHDCVQRADEMTQPIRLAVLLSGNGTTLQNLIDRIADGRLAARIVQVISSRADAGGIERAKRAGLPVEVVGRKSFPDLAAYSGHVFDLCRASRTELVCLAGFLQLLQIPPDYVDRILNIHPALLPAFGGKGMYGRHVHEAVLAHCVKVSGCTVHFVDQVYDHGPIVLQKTVEVREDDTPETLAARVFAAECEAYPEAIRLFAEGRLRLDGRRVRVD
jgi:formyltetrahydrofolate-dependent phosphoribosylglycinamide formyltransferase